MGTRFKAINLGNVAYYQENVLTYAIAENLSPLLFKNTYQYTFPELKLMYQASGAYAELFCLLRSQDWDYKIRVLRQLLKRDALHEITQEKDLSTLAGLLDQKPLHNLDSHFHFFGAVSVSIQGRFFVSFHLPPFYFSVKTKKEALLQSSEFLPNHLNQRLFTFAGAFIPAGAPVLRQ